MDAVIWPAIYGVLAFTAGVCSLSITVYLSPHWRHAGARFLALLTFSLSIWCMAYGMEFISPFLEIKIWWAKAKFFGSSWVGICFLGFVLSMTGRKACLKTKIWQILYIVPLTWIFLILTNNIYHFMWEQAWVDTTGLAPILLYNRNFGFWGFIAFNYILICSGTCLAIYEMFVVKGPVRKQMILITSGSIIPWVSNIFYQFGFETLNYFDLTPVAIAVSSCIFAYGIIKYQVPGLLPMAHEAVANSMTDPVIVLDMQDRIIFLNKTALAECEIKDPVRTNLKLSDVFFDLNKQILKTREHHQGHNLQPFVVKTLSRQWYLKHFPLLDRGGRAIGKVISLRDITDRKNIERALRERKRIEKIILEASPNPILFSDENGKPTYLNPSFTKVFGWTLDDLLERDMNFMTESDGREIHKGLKRNCENIIGTYEYISERHTKAGELLDVFVAATVYRAEGSDQASMVVNFTDISQLKSTERELLKTRDLIQNILDSMPSALIGLNSDGIISHWNLGAEEMTRIAAEKAIGSELNKVFPVLLEHVPEMYKLIVDQKVIKVSKIDMTVNEKLITADITVYPILPDITQRAVIRIDDVSDRVRIEKMMVQSEKMLSIGGLAAGMAHEINNPLAGILQNTQVIWNRLGKELPANIEAAEKCGISLESLEAYIKNRKIDQLMELVKSSGNRAANIVRNMLSFARSGTEEKTSHYLGELMEETIELVKNDYHIKREFDFMNIKIIKEYQDGIEPVPCEKNEIQQVFLNILKNGTEAMADMEKGAPCFVFRYYSEKNHSVFEIQDNGTGIDSETKKRIFDPFFTTKDIGKGAGLGLSVAYFLICEHHKGSLTVNSSIGKGSTFIIRLPFKP